MKIQTFTIVAGTAACNAKCPYCISKMTPKQGVNFKQPKVNWGNFEKACRLSQVNGVSTVLITGKGEPTLYPEQLTEFLKHMKKFNFPLIELQTNALVFGKQFQKYKPYLKKWKELGLNTMAISIVNYSKDKNKKVYTPNSEYIDLEEVIKNLHDIGYSIRLCCMMFKGSIDSVKEVKKLAQFAKKNNVEQLTIRSIKASENSENKKIREWTKKHALPKSKIKEIGNFLQKNARKLMTLGHGAIVYDLNGQNIANSDCLTIKADTDELRQLIFFPDGHLRYDWQYPGAILM